MNINYISRNVGIALVLNAAFMFLSVIVSLCYGMDEAFSPLFLSGVITVAAGSFPLIFVKTGGAVTLKEGFFTIVLTWLLVCVFGALPYILWGGEFSVVDAWFESVSGYTTTGCTSLRDVEALPKSLLFWRSSTHFIGGLGVVVFLLLIIPTSSPISLRLKNMELSNISKESYSSRANKTVSTFAWVYIGICVLAFLSYWAAGMSPFDAINHAFSVCATGGFSTKTLSIGAYNSVVIDVITIVFMFLASIHFGLIFIALVTRSLRPLNNPVIRAYVLMLSLSSIAGGLSLKLQGAVGSWGRAFLESTFQMVSYASTTGFAIADNSVWPALPCFLLMLMSLVCGCAGSTTGGMKVDRILVLGKAIRRQTFRSLNPSSVLEIRLGSSRIKDEDVYPQVLYVAQFFLLIIMSVILCLFSGDPNGNALTGSLSCLANVGPSLGSIGSLGNYNAEPTLMKAIFTMDMFLGRVEIYPVFAALYSIFHSRRKL